MAKLPTPPEDSKTVQAIYKTYEDREAAIPWRGHLGGSVIGRECSRALWYGFRWATASNFSGRLLRLFQTGHLEEPRIVADLRAIGCTIHEVNPGTGEQFRYTLHGGHFGGSFDGVVLGLPEAPKTWHLIEMKTHNAKSFNAVKKHGVAKSKPEHYAQMQTYMGMGGLTRALYVARCKNTDALYTERIKYVASEAKALRAKALQIIDSTEPLTKAGGPDSFVCKWCDHRAICHEGELPEVNCRTCAHSTPVTTVGGDARWVCHGTDIDTTEQRNGCADHIYIPALVDAEPVDAGENWVRYLKGGGVEFVNCGAGSFPAMDVPHYGSIELRSGFATIGVAAVEAAREILGAEVVEELPAGQPPLRQALLDMLKRIDAGGGTVGERDSNRHDLSALGSRGLVAVSGVCPVTLSTTWEITDAGLAAIGGAV